MAAGVTLGALVATAPAVSARTLGGQTAASVGGPVVGTTNGPVRGLANGAVDEFLGIPNAAPPVGALRWQPPQPAPGWSGVRDATQFAPHCPQPPTPFGQASTSEDCLFLNVFTPSHEHGGGSHHPVMVWIHGGALVTGESNDYIPTGLVEDGVTVVTSSAASPRRCSRWRHPRRRPRPTSRPHTTARSGPPSQRAEPTST